MCIQPPSLASNANANASATASVAVSSVSAEADVKSGALKSDSTSESRTNGHLILTSASKIVVSEQERKKWRFSNDDKVMRIEQLAQGPTFELRAALDCGEITAYAGTDYYSILHLAVRWGSSGNVALLIERGADVNELDGSGRPLIALIPWRRGRFARTLKLLHGAGAHMIAAGEKGISYVVFESVAGDNLPPNNRKCIETLIALGADLELLSSHTVRNKTRKSELMTPLHHHVRCFSQQFPSNLIEALVACGADTSSLEEAIAQNSSRSDVEACIRDQVKKGEEIFMQKQLPFVRQQLQETFATYRDGQLFGNAFAPIINAYAGHLIHPRRVYTREEQLAMLDELAAEEEAEEKREASSAQNVQSAEQLK